MSNERKAAVHRDIRRLIAGLTGFDEKDENYHRCVQYAESKIKYHRYLRPDSHKIHRAIDGLCEKFQVHSQGQKAMDLKDLTEQFLDQPGLDGKDIGKTDVHYSMLSLLLNLAHTPTLVDFERKKPELLPEEVDNFDWKAYLLDPSDVHFLSHASSESEEEESLHSDTDESDTGKKVADASEDTLKNETGPTEREPADQDSLVTTNVSGSVLSHDAPLSGNEMAQLEENLVVEYWKGKSRENDVGGSHAACNMSRDWKSYQQRLNPFQTFQNQVAVTETQVIRETLWMLSGVTDLFIFRHDDKGFILNPDVYVLHLTPESLENSLQSLMYSAQQVHLLDTFVTDTVTQLSHRPSTEDTIGLLAKEDSWLSNPPPPSTYLAFANCVSDFLKDLRKELCRIEMAVMKQAETVLLTSLNSELQPWMRKVEAVHRVILHGVTSGSTSVAGHNGGGDDNGDSTVDDSVVSANCRRATLLLDTLFQSLLESDLAALTDDGEMASLLLPMLIKTSEPLLRIISDWIYNGTLADVFGEFVLSRNKDIKRLDETFWEKAFIPRVTSRSQDEFSLSKSGSGSGANQSSTVHQRASQFGNRSSLSGTDRQAEFEHSPDFVVRSGPKLLQPILREAILTGKSMEVLDSLDRKWEVLDIGDDIFQRIPTLYELFVDELHKALPSKRRAEENSDVDTDDGCENDDRCTNKQNSWVVRLDKDPTIESQLNLPGYKDTLMNINFARLFTDPTLSTEGRIVEPVCPKDVTYGLRPLMRLCESCLYPHVSAQCKMVSHKLVRILKEEFNLMDCLHAMQRYYLMSAGEVMYDFCCSVFKKIENREPWQDCFLLEMFLHEAVESVFPEDVPRLSVDVDKASKAQQKSAINATDCIKLKYNVPWSVGVVISSRCQELYSDVFSFILQIKRAKYTLDQLRFDDLSREQAVPAMVAEEFHFTERSPRKSRVHQFHLLRFRLLYFVNSLHSYIMSRILHSTELEFGEQLDAAQDLDEIIRIHGRCVDVVHERCLLHPRMAMLREATVRVLNLSLTFGTQWRHGVDFTSGEAIQEIDTELTRCIHFLSSFLQNVCKRGSYPHLESLAFALSSSLQKNS